MLRFYYLLTQKVFECFSLAGLIFLFFSVKPVLAEVKINEFVPDSSSQEWIEFYNSSPSAEYLKDYYIDDDENFLDDSGSSAKKALTNLDTSNPNFPVISLSSSILNNSGDWVVLFDKDGNKVDSYQYTADPGRDISIGRYPDYSGNFFILSYSTKGDANAPPVTPTPSPTPSPTPTPTQSSEKPKATLKINEARDQNDSEVNGTTKIYIDGDYTGNYASTVHTYTFCDDCKCGSNNVPCGFGSHTIKVEKTGYKDWTKTIDISAGNNYEETPILILETPSPTPTPKPSATPKASPTPSLEAENTIQASESALTLNSSSEPRVLGLESAKIEEDKEASGSDSYFNLAAVFFIIAGLSFLSAASYAYFKSKKKKEEKQNENKDSEDQEDF